MPSRQSMADFMAEQQAIENTPDGDARHGLATVPDMAPPTAAAIPEPPSAPAGDGPLDAAEQVVLAVCEEALENLRVAFWAAGKALQGIRDGRLYRSTHDTFEAYVEDRWDMKRAYADKLIRAWPLAERLDPIGSKDLNEAQVRELLPVEQQHGQDAAALVYETVVKVDDVRVTAAVLRGVAAILPPGRFNADEATAQIRAYLSGDWTAPPAPAADPVELASQAGRTISKLEEQITALVAVLKSSHSADPELVGSISVRIQAVADRLKHDPSA